MTEYTEINRGPVAVGDSERTVPLYVQPETHFAEIERLQDAQERLDPVGDGAIGLSAAMFTVGGYDALATSDIEPGTGGLIVGGMLILQGGITYTLRKGERQADDINNHHQALDDWYLVDKSLEEVVADRTSAVSAADDLARDWMEMPFNSTEPAEMYDAVVSRGSLGEDVLQLVGVEEQAHGVDLNISLYHDGERRATFAAAVDGSEPHINGCGPVTGRYHRIKSQIS